MGDQNPERVSAVSEQNQRSGRGGRPEYKPTDEQRSTVRRMAADKAKKAEIAAAICVTRATLRKHFKAELASSVDQAGQLDFNSQQATAASEAAAPGRPPFEPTYRQREDVRLFKADDWSDDRIARRLGISRTTLREHFKEELADGADAVRAEVLRNLMQSSRKGNVAASNALLRMSGIAPPPPSPKDPPPSPPSPAAAPEPPKPVALGKKDQAKVDALNVPEDWAELMTEDAPAN